MRSKKSWLDRINDGMLRMGLQPFDSWTQFAGMVALTILVYLMVVNRISTNLLPPVWNSY